MSRRALTPSFATVLAVLLVVCAAVAPVPYVAYLAGPTFDTLGTEGDTPVIDIEGREVFPTTGRLDLTTVEVQSGLTLSEALLRWFRRDQAVLPRDVVFAPGQTREQIQEQNEQRMVESKDAAITAALTSLNIPVEVSVAGVEPQSPAAGALQEGDVLSAVDGTAVVAPGQLRSLVGAQPVGSQLRVGYRRGTTQGEAVLTTVAASEGPSRPVIGVQTAVTDFPFDVTISLRDVGGPSAGLMFALGVVDKLDPGSLTGGRYVAGTGEITADGVVGPIGGIQQKLVGARRKGAEVFLVPEANCASAADNTPDGLRLVKVGTLQDALSGLRTLRDGGTPPSC